LHVAASPQGGPTSERREALPIIQDIIIKNLLPVLHRDDDAAMVNPTRSPGNRIALLTNFLKNGYVSVLPVNKSEFKKGSPGPPPK
jgi:hypothetical protein